jgi:hypothetical protein
MKRTRHSAEEIVNKLLGAATALAGGKVVEDAWNLVSVKSHG